MRVGRRSVVLLFLLLVFPRVVAARPQQAPQQQICAQAIPANVAAGMLAADMMALLRRSETFRSQCERIAAEPRVQVKLEIVNTLDSGRAQTAMRRYSSGVLRADVVVLFGENYRELLAHEFEHIIEQLDGVNLREEAAGGRAWLLPGGAFETRRAFAIGMQVLREVEIPHAHVVAGVPATR